MKTALLFVVVNLLAFSGDAVAATFRGLATEGRVEGIFFENREGNPEEFRASDYVRSDFYYAPKASTLEFFKVVPAKEEGDEPEREIVGRVKWPDGSGPFLVLVSRSGERYRFSVAPDDDKTFPMGSFRVINASGKRVQVAAGEKVATINPKAAKVLKPKPPEEGKGILFQVTADLDPARLVYSNVWSGSQTSRTLVFIVNRANPNYPIGVKRLHESDLVMKYQREREEREKKGVGR